MTRATRNTSISAAELAATAAAIVATLALALAAQAAPKPAAGPAAAAPRIDDAAVPVEEEIFGWIEEITAKGIRRAGHPANLWVEDYLVDHFRRLGLQEITKQPVQVTAWHEGETGLTVSVGGRSHDFNAYPVAYVRKPLRAEAPLVKYREGLEPAAMAGKIVVFDYLLADESALSLMASALAVNDPKGDLHQTKHAIGILGGRGRVGRSAAVVNRILEAGPAGVVVVMKNYHDSPYIFGSPVVRFTGPTSGSDIPTALVAPSVGARLDALIARGDAQGTLVASARTEEVTTHNVSGILPGASPEIIQIVSHTDGNFSGAFQDAAGMSLVLAQAKYWSQIPREKRPFTLLFLLTSAHIQGSVGEQVILAEGAMHTESGTVTNRKAGAAVARDKGRLARTMLDIHLESPAREYAIGADGRLVDVGRGEPMRVFTSMAPALSGAVSAAVKAEDVDRSIVLPADVLGGHPRSAAGHFHGAGIPVVSFIGVPVYYFDGADGTDKVHRENLVPMTRATIRIIESMRGQTKASLLEGSDDIPRGGYEATSDAFKRGENTSARAQAHVQFVLSFDRNGNREIDPDEEPALLEAVRKRLAR